MRFYLAAVFAAVVGAALVVAGVAMWSHPAAVIVAGVELLAGAVLALMARDAEGVSR